MYRTDQYEGMIAETMTMPGQDGDDARSYLEREVRDKIREATEA